MKLSITGKLFVAFLFTILLVVVTMAISVRLSFQSGFLDYVNRVEVERLESLVISIGDEYQKNGSWQFVKFKHGIWDRLINPFLNDRRGINYTSERLEGDKSGTHDFTDLGLRLAILDEEKAFVAGNRNYGRNAVHRPIYSAGKQVGWLSITPSTALTDTVDIQFKEQQNTAALLISIASIFFAALIAVLLSRNLMSPVRKLVTATRTLKAGNLGKRIEVTSVDEIGQLQSDFNSLAETLERNEQARRQWFADISHELRTPMAVLLGEVEAIQDEIRKPDKQNLQSLHNEIERVNQLIDDLYQLSLSDIGALEYNKDELDIADVIQDVLSSFDEKIRQRAISVSLDCDKGRFGTVLADHQRLRQLFANLLQNTLRYTDAGGQLALSCETVGDKVIVHWQDSAPGVSKEVLGRLFERLYRAEGSRNRVNGGAGLGLAICSSIIEGHNGSISAQHSPLGGVWFSVMLPCLNNISGR